MARKILLADDSVTAQNMGRKILADAGYEVITVNNGSAALKKIAELKPDLIVLDVYMPGYSGLEVCQRLKEAAETSRLPILLTVGKLEPFKPEEAKRVRADGFIVKPFEASELLSALSKLEDKIVPRSETSKPGRFARVTASIEQGRYDKVVTNEDDLGWKDRISFPPKKKHSDEPSTVFDAPKVIEHKLADRPRAAQAEETRVDLGALAPEGLPKDVTPEEIAALAAAAAQVKGKIADAKSEEVAPVGARAEPAQLAEAFPAPLVEHKPEEKPAEKLTERIEEEIQASQEINEAAAEAASVATASPLDVIAAITGLSANAAVSPSESSGNGFSSYAVADQTANEPVTMARAGSEASRWMAVSVGFAPEEAAISLEHEMQKAYAAFAAAVNGQAAPATAVSESAPDWRQSATAAEFSPPPEAALPVESIPALPVPDPAQAFNGLANASTETIRAVVQNLEMVAESYPGETQAPAPADFRQPATDASQIVEAVVKDDSAAEVAEPQSQSEGFGAAQNHEPDFRHEELKKQDQEPEARKNEDWKNEGWKQEERSVAPVTAEHNEASGMTAERHETAAPSLANEASGEQSAISQSPSYTEAVAANEPPTEGTGEKTAERESEAAATTAAAWASWRQIRESNHSEVASEEHSRNDSEEAVQPQAAAMAVAAGAEKTPDELSAESNSDSDPAAIASIVDSVLADLRPKIFEEISRKMGKKK